MNENFWWWKQGRAADLPVFAELGLSGLMFTFKDGFDVLAAHEQLWAIREGLA